jgi:peptidoglycan/xylan/chitin deacetylase (PgdA/CDA1 family)
MNNSGLVITTSWDDGHPLDLRLADMLFKHNIRATFYIPGSSEWGTMREEDTRHLSTAFEIGAHTVNHVTLTETPDDRARQEIMASKAWVESITGEQCRMFCFPRGKFRTSHLGHVRDAGFLGARTVELFSTKYPVVHNGVAVMPTTCQTQPHGRSAYLKNVAKRRSFGNLINFLRTGGSLDWSELARRLVKVSEHNGGVFHLWGHSWEIEEYDQWQRLEDVLKFLSQWSGTADYKTNSEVCGLIVARSGSAHPNPNRPEGNAERGGLHRAQA